MQKNGYQITLLLEEKQEFLRKKLQNELIRTNFTLFPKKAIDHLTSHGYYEVYMQTGKSHFLRLEVGEFVPSAAEICVWKPTKKHILPLMKGLVCSKQKIYQSLVLDIK